MSEATKTVEGAPVAPTAPTTAAESTTAGIKPAVEGSTTTAAAALTAETTTTATALPTEEKVGKSEVKIEAQPITEGILNYKGPGLK